MLADNQSKRTPSTPKDYCCPPPKGGVFWGLPPNPSLVRFHRRILFRGPPVYCETLGHRRLSGPPARGSGGKRSGTPTGGCPRTASRTPPRPRAIAVLKQPSLWSVRGRNLGRPRRRPGATHRARPVPRMPTIDGNGDFTTGRVGPPQCPTHPSLICGNGEGGPSVVRAALPAIRGARPPRDLGHRRLSGPPPGGMILINPEPRPAGLPQDRG